MIAANEDIPVGKCVIVCRFISFALAEESSLGERYQGLFILTIEYIPTNGSS